MILGSIRINMDDIDPDKLFNGKKGQYLNLTVAINDKGDRFGRNISAWHEQTREERDAGEDKKYVGNGKVFWEKNHPESYIPKKDDGNQSSQPAQNDTPPGWDE